MGVTIRTQKNAAGVTERNPDTRIQCPPRLTSGVTNLDSTSSSPGPNISGVLHEGRREGGSPTSPQYVPLSHSPHQYRILAEGKNKSKTSDSTKGESLAKRQSSWQRNCPGKALVWKRKHIHVPRLSINRYFCKDQRNGCHWLSWQASGHGKDFDFICPMNSGSTTELSI